ncbi:restriction system protein [Nitrosomonas cryotolerans]|uniref:Restriction system protein n=1 Tax=Nitrosomonas cryotolerans ATCC 49181 TaxID=1131553 RepID=A0A1N6H3A2_9PROT|nr:restriction endonuclease [Nitrosomonas cryotolerans]SFP72389.1 restriction system protein [Nitrosomonas cryotolerans]SIO14273.1 restriction system protein [Nitrosomonas cryotolerans ATCC 49181]
MTIPKHDEIRIPALSLLSERGQLKLSEFEAPLAECFGLSQDEVHEEYESGNGKIFYDRISWALSYMNMAGLLNKPKRGIYKISPLGIEKLASPENLNNFIAAEVAKKQKNKPAKIITQLIINDESLTPQEELYASAKKIRESRYQEIIDTILSKTPREFEKLVVSLLQKMGYGGEIKHSGVVASYTNDRGIDGTIKEDVLGLGRIHIQAKRYSQLNSVGREEIQKFVGALAVAKSNKGVFITTSSFSQGAVTYAESLNGATTLILIDGQQLAEYIYDYGVGLQIEQTIEIKKLDSEFWDSMENNQVKSDIYQGS